MESAGGITFICTFPQHVRKEFLHVATHNLHLKGIGGPGAPHTSCLQRREDIQRRSAMPTRGPSHSSRGFTLIYCAACYTRKHISLHVPTNPESILVIVSINPHPRRDPWCAPG